MWLSFLLAGILLFLSGQRVCPTRTGTGKKMALVESIMVMETGESMEHSSRPAGKKDRYRLRTHLIHGNPDTKLWDYDHHVIPPISSSTTYRLGSTQRGVRGLWNLLTTMPSQRSMSRFISTIVSMSRPEACWKKTFATPYCQRPLDHGADIIVHSLSKDVGGFGTDMGGAVIAPRELHDLLLFYRKDFGGVLAP